MERINEIHVFVGIQASELHAFEPYHDRTVQPTPGFYTDFSGVRTRLSYFPPLPGKLDQLVGDIPFPNDGVHAEAIEYLSAIKAVNAADKTFTAVELGAGYGPWLAFSGKAAQRKGITRIKLIAVEADSDRRALMKGHFEDNGLPVINPDTTTSSVEANCVSVESYLAAVGDINGKLTFASAGPLDWGGSVFDGTEENCDQGGKAVSTREVDCYTISHIIRNEPKVDFLHIDIQGYEYKAVESSLVDLRSKVRFMLIETHSRVIEGRLIELLHGNGWQLINEKPCKPQHNLHVALETMVEVDGSQLWVNLDLVENSKYERYDQHYLLRVAEFRAAQLEKVVHEKEYKIWALEEQIRCLREEAKQANR